MMNLKFQDSREAKNNIRQKKKNFINEKINNCRYKVKF